MPTYYDTADAVADDPSLDTVILPVGSVEQHSHHLPLGTDYIIASAVAEAVAENLHAYLLPTLPISTCYEHKGKKGSVWMSPKTFYAMFQDIVLCLRNQGFTKAAVIVGHGGIFVMDPAIRELNALYDDLRVVKVSASGSPLIADMLEGDARNEIHAGEKETSLMLYLREQAVNREKMREDDCVPDIPREYLNYASLLRWSSTGAWGYPSLASKEKGEKIFKEAVRYNTERIPQLFEAAESSAW